MSVFAPLCLCCSRLGLYFQVVVDGNTLIDFVNATFISLQDLFWQIIPWHRFCSPTSLPWGPIKPEASLGDTFWGLGQAVLSHWCICQKHEAIRYVTNWVLCESSAFLELNYDVEVSVGPVQSFLNSPVNCECSEIIRHLFFLLLPAFCHKACGYSAMEWFRLHQLRTAAGRPHGDRGNEKRTKTPQTSLQGGWSVDYKPECLIKIAEVAAFTSNSTTANPGKARMRMKRTKNHISHLL